ncbi:MAG: DUF3048 C-terminal domain-containing protein [Clostridia bacterium]|nr:DUF3048 C-terminal domain-containing protein [Clostridia bacterium]
MKSSNNSGLNKFLSFVLIAVLLVFVVGFASNGWEEDPLEPDNGEDGEKTDNTDENTDGPGNEQTNDSTNGDGTGNDNNTPPEENGEENTNGENNENPTPPGNENGESNAENNEENNTNEPPEEIIPPPPVYINTMTGLEVSEEQKYNVPLGFVFDPSAPLYGIASSEIAIEFPIEDGTTRLLSYTTDNSELWKIGSLVETRAFISAMSRFFGGIIVSYGNDDVIPYSIWDLSELELDLSKHSGSFHRENAKYVYTSYNKLDSALSASNNLSGELYKTAPFDFTSEEIIYGLSAASSITIPYSQKSETAFYYSEKTGRYLLYKSGNRKVDMLTGENVAYENVFVLFADATTYEKEYGTELVMDVTSGGRGYYLTKGTLTEITWALNEV